MSKTRFNPMSFATIATLALLCAAPCRAYAGGSDGCTADAQAGPSIQQAVNSGCAHIHVKPGTYHENVVIAAGQTVAVQSLECSATTCVDGGGAGSVFTINQGANVTLKGLTIQNGSADGGGGIENESATITLHKCLITGNSTNNFGGGVFNGYGTLTLTNSRVTNNNAFRGGGIGNFEGDATLNNSPVTGNTASGDGGGIANFATVTLISSPVTDNTAGGYGGGIYNQSATLIRTASPVKENKPTDIVSF